MEQIKINADVERRAKMIEWGELDENEIAE